MTKSGVPLFICALAASCLSALAAFGQESPASGSITVAGETISFQIDICTKISNGEISSFSLGASTQTADGGMAMIQVTVSTKANTIEHTVTLLKMGTQLTAYAKKMEGEGWKDAQGEPAGPLVTVIGKRVSASGTFYKSSYPPQDVGIGTLTAECAQVMTLQTQ